MKHAGKAQQAAFRLILLTLGAVLVILAVGLLAKLIGTFVLALSWALVLAWCVFAAFTLYFFRDPDPQVPAEPNLVISPGTGTVDAIDTVTEPEFMGGDCLRVSTFLSIFDVHVQRAPVSGRVACFKYSEGQFLSALKSESATCNENVLLGFDAAEQKRIGVRLIAGVLARRILPWVHEGEIVQRGERIGLIQFGSRVDVYLPGNARVLVKLGDKAVGGKTVLASLEQAQP